MEAKEGTSKEEKKTMVDTLRSLSNYRHGLSADCEYTQKSTTEPDNGHNSETLKLDYKQESVRLASFIGFESDAVKPEDLAKAGFYFLNVSSHPDLVKCAYCNAEICRWEIGDDPWEEHMKWSPNCPFVRQRQSSSNRRSLPFLSTSESGQDVCGNAEIFYNSLPENETFRLLNGMVRNYAEEKVRLESFATWPKKQKPADLAAAGFYYRGIDDHTICFECKMALKEWKDEDDPWEQHALWYPDCKHVVEKKGAEYIADVQRKFRSSVPSNSETKEKECKESGDKECKESASEGQDPPSDDGVVRCRICNTNERNIIFTPCKHIVACDECSRQFENCPVCRVRISNKVKVFIS